MLIDINLQRITYGLRICNRYCVHYKLPSQRLPHSFHHGRVQAFNTTRPRPFLSFFKNLPKVMERKPDVLQETGNDRKDGGDCQVSEQRLWKELDGKISLDLSVEEYPVAEPRGNNEQRSFYTDSTVQGPSELDSHSKKLNDTISREVMTDTETMNKELEHLRKTLLPTIEELPNPESSTNSLQHDSSSEGIISNLDTSTKDPAPLLVAETRRNETTRQSKAAVPIDSENFSVMIDLTAVESANTYEAPTPAGGPLSLHVETLENAISGSYLEPTASSQIGRSMEEGGFRSGVVVNAPDAAINKAGVSHTNIEPVKHTLARHQSDGYSTVQDQPPFNVVDGLDIPQQSRSKGSVFENFTRHEGPMSLSSLSQIPESAMQEPTTADGGEKHNVVSDLDKPSTGPAVHPKLIVRASVQEGVNQTVIKGMKPQTEKKLDSSLKKLTEHHVNDSSHSPAIARLEAETEWNATVTEAFLAASSYVPNGPDSKDDKPLSSPQTELLSWEELVNSSKDSPKHYLGMLDAYSLFLACRHRIPSATISARIIENEIGSLAFRTLLNNASKASLICSLVLLRQSGVFAALDRAVFLFPRLFKIHENVAVAGRHNSTATTPSRTKLTFDQIQVTELRTVINAHVPTRNDSTTSSLDDSMKARLDVIMQSFHTAKVPMNYPAPPNICLPAVSYLAPWENFAQIVGCELLDRNDAYSLYLFFQGRHLNVRNRNLIDNHSHYPELQAIIQNKGPAIAAVFLHVLRHYYIFQYAERLETLFPGAARLQAGVFRQNDESMSKLQRNASLRKSPDIVAQPINVSKWDAEAYANTLGSTEAFRIFTIFKNKPLEMVKTGALIARYQNYPPLQDLVHKTYNREQACRALGLFIALQVFDYPERVAIMFPGAICDIEPIPREDFLLPVSAIIPTPVKKVDQEDTTALYESKIYPIKPGVLFNTGNSEEMTEAKTKGTVFRDGTTTRKRYINGISITTFSDKELNEKTGIETAVSTISIDEDTEDLGELSAAKQGPTSVARHGESAASEKLVHSLVPLPTHHNASDSAFAVFRSKEERLDLTHKNFTVWIARVGSEPARAKWLDFVGRTNGLEAVNKAIYHLKAYITNRQRDICDPSKKRKQRVMIQRLEKANRSYRVALAEKERFSQHGRLYRMHPDLTKTATAFLSKTSPQITENVVNNVENWLLDEALVDDEILREARKMTLKARPRRASLFALSELNYCVARRIAEHGRETDISKRRLITINLERANELIARFKALREAQHGGREHDRIAASRLRLKSTLNEMRRRLKKIRATVISENPGGTISESSEIAQLEDYIRLKEKGLNNLPLKIEPRVLVENGDVQSNGSWGAEDLATPEVSGHAEDIDGHVSSFGQVEIDNGEVAMVFETEDDAVSYSANATDSVVKCANLPFTIQHMLLGSIIDDFKREIFRYGTLHFPGLLQKVGWDCAESVGIPHFQKMVTQGRLPSQQQPSIYLDSNHFFSFVEELESLRFIRNAHAHEAALDAVLVKQVIADMINLAKALDAPGLTSKMRRFHEDLVAFLDQSEEAMKQSSVTIHSKAQEIQAIRSRLDQEEIETQQNFALELERSKKEHSRQLQRHVIESLESTLADIRSQYKLDEVGKEVDDPVGPTV